MTTTELEKVKEHAVEFSTDLTRRSVELEITDTASLEIAAEFSGRAKGEVVNIRAGFKMHKDNAFKTHRDLCADEAKAMAPFLEVIAILKPKVIQYSDDQDRIRREAKQEADRKQRLAEAEAQKKAKAEQEKHAEDLMDAGDLKKAEAVIEAPVIQPVAAIVPVAEVVKVKGAGTKKIWKGRVLDFSKVPEKFKMINQQAVDRYATALKKDAEEPGLEFYPETKLSGK